MSHYTEISTAFKDGLCLVQAIKDMGFAEVFHYPEAQALYGWHGDARPQEAEIVVRRQHVGEASNDIGFARQSDGTYRAIISEYDRSCGGYARTEIARECGGYNDKWLGRLTQQYNLHVDVKKARTLGYAVEHKTMTDGSIKLVLRR